MVFGGSRWSIGRAGGLAARVFAAVLLPLLVNFSLLIAFSAQLNRTNFETAATERARHVMTAVDAQLERTRGAAAALVTNRPIREGKWRVAYSRAKEIAEQNPDWDSVILWDRQKRVAIFDTSRAFERKGGVRDFGLEGKYPSEPSDLVLSNIDLTGDRCPCIYAHASAGRDQPLMLTVRLNPAILGRILKREAGAAQSAYILDRAGNIIGKTSSDRQEAIPPKARLGLAKGLSGSYRTSKLRESAGYTVFARSTWTGWSTHLSYPLSAVDGPKAYGIGAALVAALASLAIALFLGTVTSRDFAARRRLDYQMLQAAQAEAAEQSSIARDLHDGILQFLAGTLFRTEAIKHAMRDGVINGSLHNLEELQTDIRQEQKDLRRLIEALGPEMPTKSRTSILDIRVALSRRWGVEIVILPFNADDHIPETLRRDIEFLVREAVANAVSHGNASKIVISFSARRGKTFIKITDNGAGFKEADEDGELLKKPKSALPASILGRVMRHAGKLKVTDSEQGATLEIELEGN
jgi:signal transduction histidine kinase